MSDYKLELKVKNGLLSKAMEAIGIATAAELSRQSGVHSSDIGQMLNLKYAPIAYDGSVKKAASTLCEFLGLSVDEVFPKEVMYNPVSVNKLEAYIDSEGLQYINERSGSVEDFAALDSLPEQIQEVISALSDEERSVLSMHFGLGGVGDFTLQEVGVSRGLSMERVRQIEARALRKLRAIAKNPIAKNHEIMRDLAITH